MTGRYVDIEESGGIKYGFYEKKYKDGTVRREFEFSNNCLVVLNRYGGREWQVSVIDFTFCCDEAMPYGPEDPECNLPDCYSVADVNDLLRRVSLQPRSVIPAGHRCEHHNPAPHMVPA